MAGWHRVTVKCVRCQRTGPLRTSIKGSLLQALPSPRPGRGRRQTPGVLPEPCNARRPVPSAPAGPGDPPSSPSAASSPNGAPLRAPAEGEAHLTPSQRGKRPFQAHSGHRASSDVPCAPGFLKALTSGPAGRRVVLLPPDLSPLSRGAQTDPRPPQGSSFLFQPHKGGTDPH